MTTATPAKLHDGDWGIKVQGPASVGDRVQIETRAGKKWWEKITRVVWTDGQVTICEGVDSPSPAVCTIQDKDWEVVERSPIWQPPAQPGAVATVVLARHDRGDVCDWAVAVEIDRPTTGATMIERSSRHDDESAARELYATWCDLAAKI